MTGTLLRAGDSSYCLPAGTSNAIPPSCSKRTAVTKEEAVSSSLVNLLHMGQAEHHTGLHYCTTLNNNMLRQSEQPPRCRKVRKVR